MKIVNILLIFVLGNVSSNYSQSWTNYNQSNSGLTNDLVTTIAVDNNDVVWIGETNGCAFQYGLDRFDGTVWSHFDQTNSGLVSDGVQMVVTDQNNVLWLSYFFCSNGLTKFDGTTWTTYNTSNSNIPSDNVLGLFVDDNNELWLACNGITKFDGTTFINYMTNPPTGDFVSTLYATDSLVYATGENLGLYKFNIYDSTITHYTQFNSNIPSQSFGTLAMDQNHLLWMGSQYGFSGSIGGIATFDGQSFTAINPFSNTGTWVYYNQSIAVDQYNHVWVATRCEGLYNYDGVTWTHITPTLPANGCAGFVYADHYNRIWYGDVFSGVWTNSATVGLANPNKNGQMIIFPNPSKSIFHLSNTTGDPLQSMSVYSYTGEELFEKNEATEINLSAYVNGIYFYKIYSKSGKFYSGKIIKE